MTPDASKYVWSSFDVVSTPKKTPSHEATRFAWRAMPPDAPPRKRGYRDRMRRATADSVAAGLKALAKLPTVQEGSRPTSVTGLSVFGRPAAAIRPPLNLKTTENQRRAVTLPGLEPSQELLPLAGLRAYIARPRLDPVDIAQITMRDGRVRLVIQEGHTRVAAAKLRGDEDIEARVWRFAENERGEIVPVPRGWHKRGLATNLGGEGSGDLVGHPFRGNQWTTGGGKDSGGAAVRQRREGVGGGGFRGHLAGPTDAVESVLSGEKVNISAADVREFLEEVDAQEEHPNLTDVHVEGMKIFGGRGLGIPRKDMPQIPKEHRQGFVDGLRAEGIDVVHEMVSPLSLAPTQKEVSAKAVGSLLAHYEASPGKKLPALLVSQDNRVLDGHHGWGMASAVAVDEPGLKIPILRVMMPTREALVKMHAFGKVHGIERKAMGEHKQHPSPKQLMDDPGWGAFLLVPSYREKLLLLGGEGSGEKEGHPFRGNQWSGKSHADKPSLKGKNVSRVLDHADDAVVQDVLGLDSEAAVRDLAESMVQYTDQETFSIKIATEGGEEDRDSNPMVRMTFTGSEGTTITREFTRDEDGHLVADHDYFRTHKTGGGVAKDILRASFDEYQKLGVDKVIVHANIDVGAYAWAKFGFRLTEPEHMESSVREWIGTAQRNGYISESQASTLRGVASEHSGEDTLLWAIADTKDGDQKIGASVLINGDWYGELRLDDDAAMARLHRYIAEEKQPSAAETAKAQRTAAREARAQREADRSRTADAKDQAAQDQPRVSRSQTTRDELAAALRHSDEIQAGFNALQGKDSPSAQEQREALTSQEKATNARIRKLQTRLQTLSADPPDPTPEPKTPSTALFYEEEDGTTGDRDLWRDLLGDDFPEDLPPPTPKALNHREKLAFLLGGEGSGEKEGHPFRGNQWSDGGGTKAMGMPRAASNSTVESVTKHVETVATRMGFEASRVDVVDIEPRQFEVNGRQLREGGHFDPKDGRIEINVRTNSADTPAIQGLIAHEVRHAQDQATQDAAIAEHTEISKTMMTVKSGGEYDRLFTRGGYPRDSRIAEIEQRWPASATLAKYHPDGDSYLGTWTKGENGQWAFDEVDNRTRADRMEQEDGFTAYSKLYWDEYRANQTSGRGYMRQRAIQETVAEVAAYHDRAPRGPWKEGVPTKSWQAYGEGLNTVYPKVVKK